MQISNEKKASRHKAAARESEEPTNDGSDCAGPKTETKSDSNNNTKLGPLDSNLGHSQTKVTYDEEIRDYSHNSFELYDKSAEETSSERSEEEQSPADDAISWLEFHERMRRANDDVDSKLDQFCDAFAASQPDSWPANFQVQVVSKRSKSNRKTIVNEAALSKEKKSALLSALSQIDEEKNDSNPFHAIFESVNKKSLSIRTLDKMAKP